MQYYIDYVYTVNDAIYIYIYRGGILSLSLSLLCKEVKNLSLFSLQKNNNNNGDKQKK